MVQYVYLINQDLFWAKLSDPSLDGLKSLKSNGQPYKYPIKGLGFLKDFSQSSSTSRERQREPKFPPSQSPHFEVLRSWLESSSGRSQVYETSKLFRHVLYHKKLIWEHPDPSMEFIHLDLWLIMVFIAILFCYNKFRDA